MGDGPVNHPTTLYPPGHPLADTRDNDGSNGETETMSTTTTPAPDAAASAPADPESLRPHIVEALKQVYDPEIPVNIYELGLIYGIDIHDDGTVAIDMTLTAPGCPVAGTFPDVVAFEVEKVEGVKSASVELVWEPPWTPDRMSEAAKLELGLW